MRVTIADVAAKAGVGAGTVSRVLNGSPRVSEGTRSRVLAAIESLDYHPNPMARGLSKGRCQTLGVVVPFFTHASAVERLRGVVDVLDRSRYDLVLFNVESPIHRDEHFAALTRRDRADGLLVMSLPPPAPSLKKLAAAGVPVVLLDARGEGVPMVVTDDVEGGRIATRHLVELGHRRIAFIGDDPGNPFGFTSSADRERGFRETMAASGLDVGDHQVRHGPHVRSVARDLASHLLKAEADRPTAIFAASDTQALGVLESARDLGLAVPGDVSVVGFDDIEVSGYASLTTVRQPLYESGRLAAALLLESLGSSDPVALGGRQLDVELVVRSTTGPPPPGEGRTLSNDEESHKNYASQENHPEGGRDQ